MLTPERGERQQGQGHRLFQRRVGPARFERRPTILKHRELLVGQRGEAPLVPPYILPSFKMALALQQGGLIWTLFCRSVTDRLRSFDRTSSLW